MSHLESLLEMLNSSRASFDIHDYLHGEEAYHDVQIYNDDGTFASVFEFDGTGSLMNTRFEEYGVEVD